MAILGKGASYTWTCWNGLQTDVVIYNAAISDCGKDEKWAEALQLFADRQDSCPQQDVIIYNAAISACGTREQYTEDLRHFADLQHSSLQPTISPTSAVISAREQDEH